VTATEIGPQQADGSFSEVFGDALRGVVCAVRGRGELDRPLPVDDWLQPVTPADEALLTHCRGATLDVGCGPGRMSAHLAETGHVVLALDIVREAVRHARVRGVSALHRNVFDPLPGEGRWKTVLLADGNIGIGGAPLRLLGRAVELLAPEGRVVCDLAAPGTGLRLHDMRLVTAMKRSGSFPWAEVGTDAIGPLAAHVGLRVALLDHHEGRWFAVLSR
jgi:SAM-dependent methyltransferase